MVIETEIKSGVKRIADDYQESQDNKRSRHDDNEPIYITDLNFHMYNFENNMTLQRVKSISIKDINNLNLIIKTWAKVNCFGNNIDIVSKFFELMQNIESINIYNIIIHYYNLLTNLYKNYKLKSLIINTYEPINGFYKLNINTINSLRVLSLTGLKFNSIPVDIYYCSHLEILDLSNNSLTSIGGDICKLKTLRHLNISNNSITYLPKEFKELINLENLNISNNKIKKLGKEFASLLNLKELDASACNISSITNTPIFPNIENLNLSKNMINRLPDYFGNFINLKMLLLENNVINDLDYLNVQWDNLEFLRLQMNLLSNIPIFVYTLNNLRSLNLSGNTINYIDPEIKNLKKLESLNFFHNIICNIPVELGELTELKFLSLKNNMIEEIPVGVFMNMKKLQSLSIDNNYLVSLPDDILSLGDNLKYIYYMNNPYINMSQRIKMFIEMIAGQRDNYLYSDNQSVHDRQIQQSFIDSINALKSLNLNIDIKKIFNEWIIDPVLSSSCKDEIYKMYADKTEHVTLKMNYKDIFTMVWAFIHDTKVSGFTSEVIKEIKTIMSNGIMEVAGMCFTGKTTVLISCLCGFTDKVNIGLTESEELGNIIIAVKRQLIKTGDYSIEKHKENVTKAMKERGFKDDIISVWVDNIIEE